MDVSWLQALMEQVGTAANRASGLALESAYLCSLCTQAVRGDHSLLPDGMRPVVLQRDSHNRSTSGLPATSSGGADSASAQLPAEARSSGLPAVSINPGYAPIMVSPGSGVSHRFRMPTSVRSVSVAGNPSGQMEMFMSPGTDPVAGEMIEEMLANTGIRSSAEVCGPSLA
jgi:hypothetical protein